MQEKHRSSSKFSQRTDLLASALGVLLRDLPRAIGISERMFYGYRSAKYPVTAKVWIKLEAAERAAGVSNLSDPVSKTPALPANNSGNPNEILAPEEKKVTLESLAETIAELKAQMVVLTNAVANLAQLATSHPSPLRIPLPESRVPSPESRVPSPESRVPSPEVDPLYDLECCGALTKQDRPNHHPPKGRVKRNERKP